MTRDKIQKREIRERMTKTGERYTTARHFHLDLHHPSPDEPALNGAGAPKAPDAEPAGLPPRQAEPGMSEEAVRRGAGKTWDEWFVLLDAWGAREKTHPEIARHVSENYGIDGWWAQGVTVGYERARGMRAVNERPDGFSVNASKTVAAPVERLYQAFVEESERDRWLDPGELRLRTSQPHRTARFDVTANGTRLGLYFTSKGPAKASVQIQHERLPSADDVAPWRAHWKARLERLAAMLAEHDPDT